MPNDKQRLAELEHYFMRMVKLQLAYKTQTDEAIASLQQHLIHLASAVSHVNEAMANIAAAELEKLPAQNGEAH